MAKPQGKRNAFKKREPKEFEEEVIQIDRVTRVVKGGRKLRFRATVVIGNKKGKVGIGVGKSVEVTGAIQKAIAKAKKEMIKVTLDGSTIPHETKIKFKSSRILLMPAVPGTGLIAGGTVRKVLELAGVKDILSKCYGTTNKVNNTKGAFEALKSLRMTPRMANAKSNRKEEAAESKAKPAKEKEEKVEKAPAKKATAKKATSAKKPAAKKTTKKEESK